MMSKAESSKIVRLPVSTAPKSPDSPQTPHVVELTLEAFRVVRESAAAAAEAIATGSSKVVSALRDYETQLDSLDRDIDDLVTVSVTRVDETQARELLACMKYAIALERIGDLLLSFGNRVDTAGARLEPQDTKDLTMMASRLEQMLRDVEIAYRERNLERAVAVLRSDAELDRLRNLVVLRHLEPLNSSRQESFHVLFMAQELERAGDHAKNIAEEVCHFVSGRPVRHVLRSYDKPVEQMFIDHMRSRSESS
jgi:phosphate transport system protein